MILIAIISLILGITFGKLIPSDTVNLFSQISDYILYILMFTVGISVGNNKSVFRNIKKYKFTIFIIPFGIVIGTIVGGIVSSFILNIHIKESVSIVLGMGWYSLSGILISELLGTEMGTIAFFSNLIREIISFLLIPFVAKYLNYYTAIASAAATSSDTTLPILIKYTNEEIIIIAVVNGIICSSLVPILIPFFYNIFNF